MNPANTPKIRLLSYAQALEIANQHNAATAGGTWEEFHRRSAAFDREFGVTEVLEAEQWVPTWSEQGTLYRFADGLRTAISESDGLQFRTRWTTPSHKSRTLAQRNLAAIRAAYTSGAQDALERAVKDTGGELDQDWSTETTWVIYPDGSRISCNGPDVEAQS